MSPFPSPKQFTSLLESELQIIVKGRMGHQLGHFGYEGMSEKVQSMNVVSHIPWHFYVWVTLPMNCVF